jgi:hypothetical protein
MMGDDLNVEMIMRSFDHVLQYGEVSGVGCTHMPYAMQ